MIPKNWLQSRIDIKTAEIENTPSNEDINLKEKSDPGYDPILDLPFGYANNEWKRMLSATLPSDQLWNFSSSREDWQMLCGRAGIAIVRDGNIIDYILTEIN